MGKVIASVYEVIEKIGSGGGGNVYLAYNLNLKKKVVLKADKRRTTARSELLRREVDVLKELRHSYIPQVYDFFMEDETVYTVMDYIEGESLDKPLKRGEKFSQPQVIQWAKQLLEALCYLHSPTHGDPPRGYVHSDIKPANIMRTPTDDICLIDFNIALALGEENVVGCSPGYASPEHYGLDYSSFGTDTVTVRDRDTVTLTEETKTMTLSESKSNSSVKKVVPDVRSDIYSLGATLYHLLSGQRPARNAVDVVPLSETEFSAQIVKIISKAMNPNPNLRYQTADEMLNALNQLHKNDERSVRFRKSNVIAGILLSVLFVTGALTCFVGLKKMQLTESCLKLAEYSQTAMRDGDTDAAIDYALQALIPEEGVFTPSFAPEAQKALTDALGVYDLSDGFKKYKIVELPSNPLYMTLSSDGKIAAGVYSGFIAVFDTETADIIVTLPAAQSALSEVAFLDNDVIIYAGNEGITSYCISDRTILWTGRPCTALCISRNGTTVAAIYKDEDFATIYDAATGKIKIEVDFEGKSQSVAVNDSFANPQDHIFEINENGTLLGVSFSDGSLEIYDLNDAAGYIELLDETSGYTHFEGGFYEQYFAFSATSASDSVFAVIDTVKKEQTGGFESEGYFGVSVDANGIYVKKDNLLVKIHPVTGEQTPLVTTSENLYRFSVSDSYTVAASKDMLMFFDANANLITCFEEETGDYVLTAGGTALIGSADVAKIRILKCENHSETEVFSYDGLYEHDEARISADNKKVMLFSYKQFRLYDINETLLNETDIPNAEQVYDQQFIRENGESFLKVTYNDGTQLIYSAADGELISEEKIKEPDLSLYEEFYTDKWKVEAPLHGAPVIYDKKSGKQICELDEEGYLTYVTQVGEYVIVQFVTTDDVYYGILLNDEGNVLAELPYLSDVKDDELYFDYPTGHVRKSHIYSIDELIKTAQSER